MRKCFCSLLVPHADHVEDILQSNSFMIRTTCFFQSTWILVVSLPTQGAIHVPQFHVILLICAHQPQFYIKTVCKNESLWHHLHDLHEVLQQLLRCNPRAFLNFHSNLTVITTIVSMKIAAYLSSDFHDLSEVENCSGTNNVAKLVYHNTHTQPVPDSAHPQSLESRMTGECVCERTDPNNFFLGKNQSNGAKLETKQRLPVTHSNPRSGPRSPPPGWWGPPHQRLLPNAGSARKGQKTRAAVQANIEPQRILHACSTRLRITGVSERALALASRLKNALVSSDHRPFTSPAQTTKRARARGTTNSGYVASFLRRATSKTAPSTWAV